MTGDIGKAVWDKRNRRTMREFIYQKFRMKITTFDLVDWEAVDKIIYNSTQQFRLWVTKHVRKFCGTKKYYIDGELQQMQYAPAAWHWYFRRTHVIGWIDWKRIGRIFFMRTFWNFPRNFSIWKRIQAFDALSLNLWAEKGRCNSRTMKYCQTNLWGQK